MVSALSLQWLMFDFGERTSILNAAKQATVIANIGFTAAHQQVIYRVSLAYYAERAARARVETAARSLENAEHVELAAQERHAHGIGTVVEVAQARQATAQAQLLRVQAEGAAQDAYQTLVAAMGISPMTRLVVANLPERKLPNAATEPVERIVAEALGRRPDVLAAYAAERASEDNVRAARAEFLPKLFLSATGAYNSGHLNLTAIPSIGQQSPGAVNLTGNQFGSTVFLGISVPVYDGGLRSAELERARLKADNAGLALTHTREEAVRQIVAAQNGLTTSLMPTAQPRRWLRQRGRPSMRLWPRIATASVRSPMRPSRRLSSCRRPIHSPTRTARRSPPPPRSPWRSARWAPLRSERS